MGLASDQEWNESDRYHDMFTNIGVERAYLALLGAYASVTAADVFVKLLDKYIKGIWVKQNRKMCK